MTRVEIRPERNDDAAAVAAVVTAAFGPDGDTAAFVAAVRKRAVVCLAELAIADGAVVGQAQWCAAPVVVDGRVVEGAYLSCLSVQPALQRQGIGSRLIRSGLKRLFDRGFQFATVLGDPGYYALFGFSSDLAERIDAPHRAAGRGFQAIELTEGALDGKVLRADFPHVIMPP